MRILKFKESMLKESGSAFQPQSAIFYVTYRCNLNCSYCFQRKQYNDSISTYTELMTDEIKGSFENLRLKTLFLTGGEIFLRKDIRELIEFFSCRVEKLSLFTNGTLLTNDDISLIQSLNNVEIWFSLDGMDNINDCNRGEGTFSKVIETVKKLQNKKIYFNAVITEKNIDYLDEFYTFANNMKIEQITYQFPMWYETCPNFKGKYGFDYYPGMQGEYDLRFMRRLENQILKLQKHENFKTKYRFSPSVFWDNIEDYIHGTIRENKEIICLDVMEPKLKILPNGDVVICEALKTQIGNVVVDNLKEIWNNQQACAIRKTLFCNNLTEMCSRCCSIDYASKGMSRIENTK